MFILFIGKLIHLLGNSIIEDFIAIIIYILFQVIDLLLFNILKIRFEFINSYLRVIGIMQ